MYIYNPFNSNNSNNSHSSRIYIHIYIGVCAGITNADDFFTQICSLSANPLQVISTGLLGLLKCYNMSMR